MRKTFAIAACIALAACGSNEAETDDVATVDTTVAAPGTTDDTVTSSQLAGTYEMTADDGTVTMQRLDADGTYVDTVDGTETDRGTYRQQGNQLCYTSETDGTGEECFTGGTPGADGSFEMTDANGGSATVRRTGDNTL